MVIHTHPSAHKHLEQWAAIYADAAPNEQLGVQHQYSHGIKGGPGHSLPPPLIPAGLRLKLTTFGIRVRLSNH